jgi:ankyrin repeat protein
MVEVLVRHGAEVNATGGKYHCALCAAAWWGHIEVLRVLLKNGAISNTRGRPYRWALDGAISQGRLDAARMLFEEGSKRVLETMNADPGWYLRVSQICNRQTTLANISSAVHPIHFLCLRLKRNQSKLITRSTIL